MANPISGIYIILNTKNGKVYIGQTNNFRNRWRQHRGTLRGNNHKNAHLQAAWNKYGEKAFKFQKLEYCAVEQLDDREQHYLDIFIPKGLCYNIARDVSASSRGVTPSDETRRKMRQAAKNRPPVSEETRRRLSEANRNRPPLSKEVRRRIGEGHRGKIVSREARQRMSEARKGKPHSEEHKRKIRDGLTPEIRRRIAEAHKNKSPSIETKRKMSDAMKGRHHTEDARQRMSQSAKNRPPISEETRRRLSEAHKGHVPSNETRQKLSKASKLAWELKKINQDSLNSDAQE